MDASDLLKQIYKLIKEHRNREFYTDKDILDCVEKFIDENITTYSISDSDN